MSWIIYPPLSIWAQLASLCLTCVGLNADLLVIRLFLFLGYLFNFLNAILGSPRWPHVQNVGGINIDSLVWCVIGLYVHGSALVCLILDEQPQRDPPLTEDQAALWRLLYRTGGLSQKLFETMVLPHLEVVEYNMGDAIPTNCYFYIVYQGRVKIKIMSHDHMVNEEHVKIAGEMFDFKHLDLLERNSVFFDHDIAASALTPQTKLFRIHKDKMGQIANHRFAKSLWQALLINNLANVVEKAMRHVPGIDHGISEEKLFGPLQDWELPKSDLPGSGVAMKQPHVHFFNSIRRSFSPPWPLAGHPTGIRQTQLRPPRPEPPQPPAPTKSGRMEPESPAALFPARCKHSLFKKHHHHPNSKLLRHKATQPNSDHSTSTDVGTISDATGGFRHESSSLEYEYGGDTPRQSSTNHNATDLVVDL